VFHSKEVVMDVSDETRGSHQVLARALGTALVPALMLLIVFVWSFVGAYHQPRPHDLPLGVVAPTSVMAHVQAGLAQHAPGAFQVQRYASAEDAYTAVSRRALDGALIVQGDTARVLVAGAGGVATKTVVISALSALAQKAHLRLRVQDIRPLPAHDPQGVSVFFAVFGLVVASVMAAALLYVRGRGIGLPTRLGALALYASLAGIGAALVLDPLLGALTSHFWQIALLAGVLALAVSLATAALTQLFGVPGIALAALTFIIVGNSASGGPVPYRFLPDGFRQISQLLPSGAGVSALRQAIYFGGNEMTQPILVLACWAIAGLVTVLIAGALQRSQRTSLGAEARRSAAA
jgi:hypothetical protein